MNYPLTNPTHARQTEQIELTSDTMTAPRPGTPRRLMAARRAWAQIINTGKIECRRCHRIIAPGDKWDLGHPADNPYAAGNQDHNLAPEHRKCNRAGIVKPKTEPTFQW